jgi:hypothetical protein
MYILDKMNYLAADGALNPKALEISVAFHALCLKRIFASCKIRSAIIWEVVFRVVSPIALCKLFTWIFNGLAKSEADRIQRCKTLQYFQSFSFCKLTNLRHVLSIFLNQLTLLPE